MANTIPQQQTLTTIFMAFDMEDPLSSPSAAALFSAEPHHAASLPLNIPLRRAAAALILQSRSEPLVSYLAINYVDRFLSRRQIPIDKPWIAHLLAIACLSLASKMKKIDFHADHLEGFAFDRSTIRRMEMVVLGALDWRMRSITPFSFLRFFISFFTPRDPPMLAGLRSRASQIIFYAQNETRLMEPKPSVVAASALLTAANELFPVQYQSFRDAVSSCAFLSKDKERLLECCDLMGELMGAEDNFCCGPSLSSNCDTPVTVLGHRHCPSSESEMTSTIASMHLAPKKARCSGGDFTYHHNNHSD